MYYHEVRDQFVAAGLPVARADLQDADIKLRKLIDSVESGITMQVTLLPGDTETPHGSWKIDLKDYKYEATFTSLYLYDAILAARALLFKAREAAVIKIVEVDASTITFTPQIKSVSAADIVL